MIRKEDFTATLNQAIENSGLSVPKLAARLNIDQEKIYKWRKGSQPSSAEEFIRVSKWIQENLEIVPRETEGAKPISSILEQAILNLTESNGILARNNERLVTLLETNLTGTGSASPVSEETEAVRLDPVKQTDVFVGKKEIRYDRKGKEKKKGISS